jgi:hypothetical protein
MRIALIGLTALLSFALTAGAAPALPLINPVGSEPAGAAAGNGAGIDNVLGQLEQTGQNLKDFTAKIKLTETDNSLGTDNVRVGTVQFQKKPDGTARIHVLFNMRIDPATNRGFPKDKVEYLLDGPWLIDRNYQTQNEVKRQVLKPGQKMDLFKLGEGPFPLPIGQKPQDVHQLFDVKMIGPAKDDPANTVHLQLIPKPGSDLARKFHSLDVWVDAKTHMPARVDTVDPKEQTTRSTELKDIVLNPAGGVADSDFKLPNIDDQMWNRYVE